MSISNNFIRVGDDFVINRYNIISASIDYHKDTNEKCLNVLFNDFTWQFKYSSIKFQTVSNTRSVITISQKEFTELLHDFGLHAR